MDRRAATGPSVERWVVHRARIGGSDMFRDSKAFSGFAVKDLDAARTFHGGILGLEVEVQPMGILELHLATGASVLVYPKPDHVPATYTILNFPVPDVDAAVERL